MSISCRTVDWLWSNFRPREVIDPERCTECVGHYATSHCVEACPVDCIVPDPDRREDHATLYQRYLRIKQEG